MPEEANTPAQAAPVEGTPADTGAGGQVTAPDSTAQSTPAPQEGTPGKLLAGKYKTTPDLEKGYSELYARYNELARERKSPTQITNTIFGTESSQTGQQAVNQQQAQQLAEEARQARTQGGQAGENDFWAQNNLTPQQGALIVRLVDHLANQRVQDFMSKELAPLNNVLKGLTAKTAVQELQREFDDFDGYDDKIAQVLNSDSEWKSLVNKDPGKWLKALYLQIKATDAGTKSKEATVAAKVSATQTEQQRQAAIASASVEPPGSRAAPSSDTYTEADRQLDLLFGKTPKR